MAGNNQVTSNMRINADMNLRNIADIKKQLSSIVESSGFDKSLNKSIEKCINNFERLEKDFTSLSKKTIFNEKDIKLYTKSIEDLNTACRNVKSVMNNISSLDIAKGTKAYTNYIEDLNKQAATLKENFKKTTGLNFDKAIKDAERLQTDINELIEKKNQLAKSGINNEFNKLLDEQNKKIEENKIKTQELKRLRDSIFNTRETKAKEKYESYEQLQNTANMKVTKTQITTNFEQKEVEKLTKKYSNLEKQLEKVSKMKTEAARNRNITNIAKELGVDANTVNDLQQAINKAKELIDLTARKNVKNNNGIQKQIIEQYNALNEAKNAAKEYLSQIDALSNAMVRQSNLTNAKTLSGLDNDINNREINSTFGVDSDELRKQAEINVQIEIGNLETQLGHMIALMTQLVSTNRELENITNAERSLNQELNKSFLNTGTKIEKTNILQGVIQKSTADIDNDTTKIEANTRNKKAVDAAGRLGNSAEEIFKTVLKRMDEFPDAAVSGVNIKEVKETLPTLEQFQAKTKGEQVKIVSDMMSQLKYSNSSLILGNLIKSIAELGAIGDSTSKTVQKQREKIETNIKTYEEEYMNAVATDNIAMVWEHSLGGLPTNQIKQVKSDLETLSKVNPQMDPEQIDSLVQTYDTIKRQTNETEQALKGINNTVNSSIDLIGKQSEEVRKASAAQQVWNNSIGRLGVEIGTYLSLGYILNNIFNILRCGLDTIKQMDDSIVQIGVVTNKTAQEVWGDIDKYIKQAKDLHMTTTELLDATKLYYQQGLNTAEVNSMVEATARAAALGEVTMADAANTLTSIMNSYQISAQNMLDITDKISAVGSDSAADFHEMSEAIEKVASSAATAGLDIDHLMGYLGKMIEVTREAPTNIGTAMKTIVSRMAELKADPAKTLEDGTDLNRVETALKSVGIRLLDTAGNIRPLSDVIDELGKSWNDLSRNHQAYIATIIAGNRQQSRFLALMNNYDRTLELVASAQDSSGRSAQQFRNYLTGIEAAMDGLRVQGEKFLTTLTQGNNVIKAFYNSLTGIMQIANAIGPALSGLSLGFFGLTKSILSTKKAADIETKTNKIEGIVNSLSNQIGNSNVNFPTIVNSIAEDEKSTKQDKKILGFISRTKELQELNKINKEYADTLKVLNPLLEKEKQIGLEKMTIDEKQTLETYKTTAAAQKETMQLKLQDMQQKALIATKIKAIAINAAMTVGITAIIAGIGLLINHLSDVNRKERERLQAMEDNTAKMQEEYSSLEVLANKYISLEKKISLTEEESNSLKTTNDELISQYPELIAGIDGQGNAYAKSTAEIKEFLKWKKKEIAQEKIKTNDDKLNSDSTIIPSKSNNKGVGKDTWWVFGTPNLSGLELPNPEDALGNTSKESVTKMNEKIKEALNYDQDVLLTADGAKEGLSFGNPNGTYGALKELFLGNNNYDQFKHTYKSIESEYTKSLNETYDLDLKNFEDYLNNKTKIEEKITQKLIETGTNENQAKIKVSNISAAIEGADKRNIAAGAIQKAITDSMNDAGTMIQESFSSQAFIAISEDINYDDYGSDVENQLSGIIKQIIEAKKEEFNGDVGKLIDWAKDFQFNDNIALSEMLMKANSDAQANEKIKKAYSEFVKLQKEGASPKILLNAYSNYIDSISTELKAVGLYTDKNQKLLGTMYDSIQDQVGVDKDTAERIVLKIGETGTEKNINKMQETLNNFSTKQRAKYTDAIDNIINDESLGTEADRQNKAKQFSDAVLELLTINDADFQDKFEELDLNSQVAIDNFVVKYEDYLKDVAEKNGYIFEDFVKYLFGNPGVNESELETGLNEAISGIGKNKKADIQTSFNGQMNWGSAMDANLNSGQGVYSNGQFIMTTEAATTAIKENIDALETQIDLLEKQGNIDISTGTKQATEAYKEINRLEGELNKKQEERTDGKTDVQLKRELETQRENVKIGNNLVKQGWTRINNAKNLTSELEKQKNINSTLSKNAEFNEYANQLNSTISSLKDYASIYEQVQNQELSELDVIQLVSQNVELLDAVYIDETGQLALNAEALEDLAESRIDEIYAMGEAKITKLEILKSSIKADQTYSEEQQDMLTTQAEEWANLSEDVQEALMKEAQQLGVNTTGMKTWAEVVASNLNVAQQAWVKYHKAQRGEGLNEVISTAGRDERINAGGVNEVNTKTGKSGADWIKEIDTEIEKMKTLQDRLTKFKSDGGALFDAINGMGGKGSSGSGSENSFEPVIEKLEKFYNYMRQLEELEAKINRIREKRNLIDASKNYYIDDLKKENELLLQQQAIYNDYIRDQGPYLQELQQQIQSTFGDWAYFNDKGVIQVKQTEFTANSEEEEERLNTFLELVDLYKEEYNTREENITKLYEIENTQLENIAKMYEKILARVQDITDALNRQKDLLDHDMTMSFSNIAKFDMMDDQLSVAAQGIKETYGYLNEFEKEIKDLNNEIKNGPFNELLLWDEALKVWRVNEEKLQDQSIIAKYEKLGYTWQDIDTYTRSIATKSQSIRDAWKETEDSANSFAETLKSLVQDRIDLIKDYYSAATEEFNKIFNAFESEMEDIDNENDLFGVVSEKLEDKYLTLVTATVILKQTIQQLENNKDNILTEIQKKYPEYVDMINGVAIVNKQMVEESTTLTDAQKAELLQLYGVLEASEEQIDEMKDKLIDYFNKMLEMEKEKRDAIIDLKQQIHDELIARDQQEIDDLRSKYQKMNQLDQEYYNKLSQRINDARNLRSDRQQDSNIAQTQAKLAVLKTDNSGNYNSELIELQKQLNTQLQSQADNEVNRELERIQREQKQREEDRQLTISAMENVLTFKDENGWYWQETQKMWDAGEVAITGFLLTAENYRKMSDEQRAKEFADLTNNVETAFTTLSQASGESDRLSDGVVRGTSEEEQEKLANINSNIDYINESLTNSSLAEQGKLDNVNSSINEGTSSAKENSNAEQGLLNGVNSSINAGTNAAKDNSNAEQNKLLGINGSIGSMTSDMNSNYKNQYQQLEWVNGKLQTVNSSLVGDSNSVVSKIDWSNAENMKKLTSLTNATTSGNDTIASRLKKLYETTVPDGVKGVQSTIKDYLGDTSKIWERIGGTTSSINQMNSDVAGNFEKTISNIGNAANTIVDGINRATQEYMDSDAQLYNWLIEEYAKANAKQQTSVGGTGSTTKTPTTSSSSSSSAGSASGGGSSSSAQSSSRNMDKAEAVAAAIWIWGGDTSGWYNGGDRSSRLQSKFGTEGAREVQRIINQEAQYGRLNNKYDWNSLKSYFYGRFKRGGYVNFTGPAWVDGSKSSPEAFLNAKQTQLFEALRDGLVRTASNSFNKNNNENAKEEYNIDNINIEVKEIADTASIDKVVKQVKSQIYNDSVSRNNMAIRRR